MQFQTPLVLCLFALLSSTFAGQNTVSFTYSDNPNALVQGLVDLEDWKADNLNFTASIYVGDHTTAYFMMNVTSGDGQVYYSSEILYFSSDLSNSNTFQHTIMVPSCYVPALYDYTLSSRSFYVVAFLVNASCDPGEACNLGLIQGTSGSVGVAAAFVDIGEYFTVNYVQSSIDQEVGLNFDIEFEVPSLNGSLLFAYGQSCFGSNDTYSSISIPDGATKFSHYYQSVHEGNIYFYIQNANYAWKARITEDDSSESEFEKHKELYISLIVIGSVAVVGGAIAAVLIFRKKRNYQAIQ